MPIPNKKRFTDEQKQDAIQDYRFPRRSKSTAEYNHDRFLERRKTSEIYYDPYTDETTKQNIPLVEVYPEFDLLLAGKAAVDALASPGIMFKKERYGKSIKKVGDVLKTKLVTDKIKDKAEEKAEEVVLGKSKQDVIREAYEDMVNKINGGGSTINNMQDVIAEARRFRDYIDSKSVQDRLESIDKMFNTNYKNTMDKIKSSPIARTKIVKMNDRYGNAFVKNNEVHISPGASRATYGHEWKHIADYMNKSSYSKETGALNKRLNDIVTTSSGKTNMRPDELIIRDMINDGYTEDEAIRFINYIKRPTEVSSQLSDVIYGYNIKHNSNVLPEFTRESFEDILFNNPMENSSGNLRLFYKYVIDNKDDFIKKINRSAFTIPALHSYTYEKN